MDSHSEVLLEPNTNTQNLFVLFGVCGQGGSRVHIAHDMPLEVALRAFHVLQREPGRVRGVGFS